jgi:hypothetical protein
VATVLVSHEVEDVGTWLASPRREEIGKRMGWTTRTFVDPAGSNRVGLPIEVADLNASLEYLKSPSADDMEAARLDGVRLETFVMRVES